MASCATTVRLRADAQIYFCCGQELEIIFISVHQPDHPQMLRLMMSGECCTHSADSVRSVSLLSVVSRVSSIPVSRPMCEVEILHIRNVCARVSRELPNNCIICV